MIHPNTELRYINEKKGRGVFATQTIPKGTLTYVKDDLEIIISPGDERLNDPRYQEIIDTYSFIDRDGRHILSWDHAKYVNHCCQCNTMSTGYGFEIAIRDIYAGEEITDEYSMFNFPSNMNLDCDKTPCRKIISDRDLEKYHKEWDDVVKCALKEFTLVDQPLEKYMSKVALDNLQEYLQTGKNYIPVISLSYSNS